MRVFYPRLDLAFVARHVRFGRQYDGLIMLGESDDLGIELRIKPIGLGDGRPQIIDHTGVGNPAEITESVLQAANEIFRRLPPDHFAVSLAGVAEHDAEEMRPAPLAVFDDPGPLPKIDLDFMTWRTFHPAKRQRQTRSQTAHKALHRLVAAAKLMVGHQVLVNPLRREPLFQSLGNLLRPSLASALSARHRPGGRNGRF